MLSKSSIPFAFFRINSRSLALRIPTEVSCESPKVLFQGEEGGGEGEERERV